MKTYEKIAIIAFVSVMATSVLRPIVISEGYDALLFAVIIFAVLIMASLIMIAVFYKDSLCYDNATYPHVIIFGVSLLSLFFLHFALAMLIPTAVSWAIVKRWEKK